MSAASGRLWHSAWRLVLWLLLLSVASGRAQAEQQRVLRVRSQCDSCAGRAVGESWCDNAEARAAGGVGAPTNQQCVASLRRLAALPLLPPSLFRLFRFFSFSFFCLCCEATIFG